MTDDAGAILRNLADRAAILDVLGRFARGSDRFDTVLMASCYWPDAIDNHGGFNGPAAEYIDWAIRLTDTFERMSHMLGHSNVDFAGDLAAVETAFTFYGTYTNAAGARIDAMQIGRYLDRFERRGGEWRIALRQVVLDWRREFPGSTGWDELPPDSPRKIGRRGAADPLHALLRDIGLEKDR